MICEGDFFDSRDKGNAFLGSGKYIFQEPMNLSCIKYYLGPKDTLCNICAYGPVGLPEVFRIACLTFVFTARRSVKYTY